MQRTYTPKPELEHPEYHMLPTRQLMTMDEPEAFFQLGIRLDDIGLVERAANCGHIVALARYIRTMVQHQYYEVSFIALSEEAKCGNVAGADAVHTLTASYH